MTPRITAQYPPRAQQRSPQQSVLSQRLASIVRARGAEPARGPEKWAQAVLIQLDKADNYPRHRCSWIMSAPASTIIRDEPFWAMERRSRTTTSKPAKFCCRRRNSSRNTRFTRLRFTARRSAFPATINPNRGYARSLGLAKIWRNSPLARHLSRITEENSSALCNRWLFGKKRMVRIRKN